MSIDDDVKAAIKYQMNLPVTKRKKLSEAIEKHFRFQYRYHNRADLEAGGNSEITNYFNGCMNTSRVDGPEKVFFAYISTANKYDLPKINTIKVEK